MEQDRATARGVVRPGSRHLPALDGLRGVAILGVMEFHFFPGAMPGRIAGALVQLRVIGAVGVDLFFVLSGFLITGILYDSVTDSGYFRKFYARRALRIFPLYYGVLAAVFLLTPWTGTRWHGTGWVLLAYLQNTDVNGPFYRFAVGRGLSLDHFWSLAVEEQFYLVWPVVIYAVRGRRALVRICTALMLLAPVLRFALGVRGVNENYINRSTMCRMDALVAGALLALLLRGPGHDAVLRWSKAAFVGVVASLAMVETGWMLAGGPQMGAGPGGGAGFGSVMGWAVVSARYSLVAVGFAALLGWALGPRSRMQSALEAPALRFFGRYSYGLYVLHFLALGLLLRTSKGWIAAVTTNKGVGVLGAGLMAFGVSVVAAVLSYKFYERPFLRLKRLFPYDREAGSM